MIGGRLFVRKFRRGNVVRVRSAEEIMATLDSDGTVDGLLLMPQMLKFAGREVRVRSSAHKTCDGSGEIRTMDRTVHLEGSSATEALTAVVRLVACSSSKPNGSSRPQNLRPRTHPGPMQRTWPRSGRRPGERTAPASPSTDAKLPTFDRLVSDYRNLIRASTFAT